eukprot:scaffold151520_cov43-Attheya_sp.AAC.1
MEDLVHSYATESGVEQFVLSARGLAEDNYFALLGNKRLLHHDGHPVSTSLRKKGRGADPMGFVVVDPSWQERCRDHGMGYVPAEPWKYMTGLLDDDNFGPSMVGFLFESSDMIEKAWWCWRGLAIVVVSQID